MASEETVSTSLKEEALSEVQTKNCDRQAHRGL